MPGKPPNAGLGKGRDASLIERLAPWLALAWVGVLVLILFALPAHAHSWYPGECCSDKDCRPLNEDKGEWVREEGQFYVLWDGRRYPKDKAKLSPDGKYHLCENNSKIIICFYAPPGAA